MFDFNDLKALISTKVEIRVWASPFIPEGKMFSIDKDFFDIDRTPDKVLWYTVKPGVIVESPLCLVMRPEDLDKLGNVLPERLDWIDTEATSSS